MAPLVATARFVFLDWQRILIRSLRRDANNWRRSWAGGGFRVANTVALNGSPNTPAQTSSNLLNGVVWLRQARLGALSLENVNPNGTVDVPVYVDVKPGYSLAGLQFRIAVESDGPSLEQPAQFSSAPGLPQPISVDGLPANQVVGAWPLVPRLRSIRRCKAAISWGMCGLQFRPQRGLRNVTPCVFLPQTAHQMKIPNTIWKVCPDAFGCRAARSNWLTVFLTNGRQISSAA
jgi:hypothetical protein